PEQRNSTLFLSPLSYPKPVNATLPFCVGNASISVIDSPGIEGGKCCGWVPGPPGHLFPISCRGGLELREQKEREGVVSQTPSAAQTSPHKRWENRRRGPQVALFNMSVLIATQLKIDTSTSSRRVRGPFSMHGTMWGEVCIYV
ncbi:hypothetical protein ILYODFUR_007792, partial [Ilyodon furcidens]